MSVLFAKRSFQTLSGVNLYPSNKNISNDDGEYTGNHLSSTTYVDFYVGFWKPPPEERLPNEDRWVDFDDSHNSLHAGSFIYGKIIPDLESRLEIESKVKNT